MDNNNTRFTESEKQVIALLAQGKTNAQIAKETGLTAQTVKNKLQLIYRRFGIDCGNKRLKLLVMWKTQKFPIDK